MADTTTIKTYGLFSIKHDTEHCENCPEAYGQDWIHSDSYMYVVCPDIHVIEWLTKEFGTLDFDIERL